MFEDGEHRDDIEPFPIEGCGWEPVRHEAEPSVLPCDDQLRVDAHSSRDAAAERYEQRPVEAAHIEDRAPACDVLPDLADPERADIPIEQPRCRSVNPLGRNRHPRIRYA